RGNRETVRAAVEVAEADIETLRRATPYAAKWMVLADDQQALRLQDPGGFGVIAPEIRNPHGDMASRVDDIEGCVAETGEIGDIGAQKCDRQAERSRTVPCHLDLLLRDVDAGHLGPEPGQREDNLIVAAAQNRDALARAVPQPGKLRLMQSKRRVAVA